MKRILLMGVLLGTLLLSGCMESKSIGIIGGADGPTKIYVSDENGEKSEKKPVRMMKIDGELYYDTGKVSDMTSRCGTLDGALTKAADLYEIPKKENSCNFDGAEGYQNASELTKEVPIDGEWVIFKKLHDPEKDLFQYKYGYNLKGTMPNASGESELMVLANDRNLDFERVTKSLYSSNTKDFLDIYVVGLSEED